MTDRELEQRLKAFYAAEVGETETAPADLRESLAAIPVTTPTPLRPLTRRRGFTLLAVAATVAVGGALAVGSGLVRMPSVVPPAPSNALLASPGPTPAETSAPTANLRPGGQIAFIRTVDKTRTPCSYRRNVTVCPTSRIWVMGSDGRGAHEMFPDGVANQELFAWSPDGSRLLYTDDRKFSMTDANGSTPQQVDTGCVAPCQSDSQISVSRDGRRIVFTRLSNDGSSDNVATMDLSSGQVAELRSTSTGAGVQPRFSADGSQIVFWRYGDKDTSGPYEPVKDALFIVDADGGNLHQLSPATLPARSADWSPDGMRIVFLSSSQEVQHDDGLPTNAGDIYTIRPDGTDIRRLTTDGNLTSPAWTADGRIFFARGSGGSGKGAPGWWTMNADGGDAAILVPLSDIGVSADGIEFAHPIWQPLGGAAIVPPPWAPKTATVVGPPPPTPAATPTPALAPGFTWAGTFTIKGDQALGNTLTVLADGRVLVTEGCGTAAEIFDPAIGSSSPTGSMSTVRGGDTATLLRDGRVLIAGGYNCAAAGKEGMWASAELYDPTTGTFSPTGSMAAPREQHSATLLADGRVLIAGGLSGSSPKTAGGVILASYQTAETDSFLATAEIYDPATGTFSKTDSMSTPHRGHTATLLKDGRVLVVGNGGESSSAGKVADVYDPATGRFSRAGSMKTGRAQHSATLLQDGRVLILGGGSSNDSVVASGEVFDPASGSFTPIGSMGERRTGHTATVLADGRVLIAGGFSRDGQDWRVLSSTELYDPVTRTFSPIGSMGTPRQDHTANLMTDGRVLIVGGSDIGRDGGFGVTSAVIYQP